MKILYIPGLGEGFVLTFQKRFIRLLNLFRSKDNKIGVFDSLWEDTESYTDKYQRLRDLHQKNKPQIIIGPSAGGSLAINLFADNHDIARCYLVCAKIRGSEKIGEAYNRRAPALIGSVRSSEQKLGEINPGKVTSYVSKNDYDGIVEKEDMYTKGMDVKTLPIAQHSRAILYWLFFKLPSV